MIQVSKKCCSEEVGTPTSGSDLCHAGIWQENGSSPVMCPQRHCPLALTSQWVQHGGFSHGQAVFIKLHSHSFLWFIHRRVQNGLNS